MLEPLLDLTNTWKYVAQHTPHNPRTDRLPASGLSFPHSFLLLLVLFFRVPLPSPSNEMATYMGHIYHLGDDQSPTGPLQRFASMAASYPWDVTH